MPYLVAGCTCAFECRIEGACTFAVAPIRWKASARAHGASAGREPFRLLRTTIATADYVAQDRLLHPAAENLKDRLTGKASTWGRGLQRTAKQADQALLPRERTCWWRVVDVKVQLALEAEPGVEEKDKDFPVRAGRQAMARGHEPVADTWRASCSPRRRIRTSDARQLVCR